MKKNRKRVCQIVAVIMAVIMTVTSAPVFAFASLFSNSPAYNQEILQALETVVHSEDEAKKYYAVMERYGLLDEDGSVVDDLHAVIDGKEYTKQELCALLSGEYDGDKTAYVDGMGIKLDDLWNIIVIEGYIDYLRETYCLDGEWTEEHEKNYNDFVEQFTSTGVSLSIDRNDALLGAYSGINHGAVVSFTVSPCTDGIVTVTAVLHAAAQGQEVSFLAETVSGSAKAVPFAQSITMKADEEGKAEKSFCVQCVPEKIDTLIADAPVAYLNVSNLKNATFAASGRDAASIPFSGEPTVGNGKEIDRIVGFFQKYHYLWNSGWLGLTSGEKYAVNHGIVTKVEERKLQEIKLIAWDGSEDTPDLSRIDITFSLKADNKGTALLKNDFTLNVQSSGTMYQKKGITFHTPSCTSSSLEGITVQDGFYCESTCDEHGLDTNFNFVDCTAPTVESIYVPKASYTVGQTVPVTVEYSEPVSAEKASVTVNGTTLKAQETGSSDRLTFPYPVKVLDSAVPVVTAVAAEDVSGNALDASCKPDPDTEDGSLVLSDALMKSCLARDSIESIACTVDSENPAAPELAVKLTLSEKTEMTEWLSSDLDEKGVSGTLFAAVEGFERTPFRLLGDSFNGATMIACFTLPPVNTQTEHCAELYIGDDLLIGCLRYVTQPPAACIKAADIICESLVTQQNGEPYVYADAQAPVIYVQDAPSIRAVFSLKPGDYTYADQKKVTIPGDDGQPLDSSAHFMWSSSDTSVANIDATGVITPTGKAGEVFFTLTALNGAPDKAVSAKTEAVRFDTGLTPFLVIPNKDIQTVSGKDVPLYWSSNIPDKQKDATFTVCVVNGKGETVYTQQTGICGVSVPAHTLVYDYSGLTSNVYHATVSVTFEGKTLTAQADITLSSPPAVVSLTALPSFYMTDERKQIHIGWTVENFDCYREGADKLFRLYITKNDECVYESFDTPGEGANGTYTGSYSLPVSDVITDITQPMSYRDIYTVSLQAKNGSDSTWSCDSYILYVYDEDALKLWVNGEPAGDSLTLTNIPKISAMSQQQLLALKRDISLQAVVSANYGDFAWSDLSDRIAWSSSDAQVSDLHYRQGSYYQSINSYSHTSYRPMTEFMLSGSQDGSAQITGTHVLTGICDTLSVRVETLKDKLYLFSCTPCVQTTMYYTNGNGEEKTALSNENGEFAVYEESGIADDVYFSSVSDGCDYYGTYFLRTIESGEPNPESLRLYPCNNLTMRRAAYAFVYLKNPDGTPYVGNVTVRSGVYVNGDYISSARFGYGRESLATHKGDTDCRTATDNEGKLRVLMDSTQWELGADGLDCRDAVSYDFVVEKADSAEYYPLLIHVEANENEESFIRSGESIATFRKNEKEGKHPFVIANEVTMKNDSIGYSDTRNILDDTGCIGISADIPEQELSVSVMWWGVDAHAQDTYSMSVLTQARREIGADKKKVSTAKLPFAGTAVSTLTVPFDRQTAQQCGIDAAPVGLTLGFSNENCGSSYLQELSYRIADTTDAALTPDGIESMVDGITSSLKVANTSESGHMDVGDDIISLVMKLFATKNYQPDKDHPAGFDLTVMPTKDPTTFIAYLGLGLSNMSDKKVTGVYADGSSEEKFSRLPGLKEIKWFFGSGENAGQKYIDSYKKAYEGAVQKKTMKDIYFNVTGYIESRMTYDPVSELWEIHVLSGGFDAGGGIGFVKYMNTMVGYIPVTAELRGGGTLDLSLDTLTMEYLNEEGGTVSGSEFLTRVRLFFYFKFFGGLGWDYSVAALKIGLYGQVNADANFEWLNRPSLPENARYSDGTQMLSTDDVLSGQFLGLNGRVGIVFVARLLFFSYEKALWTKKFPKELKQPFRSWNTIDKLWTVSKERYQASLDSYPFALSAQDTEKDGENGTVVDLLPTTESFAYLESGEARRWNDKTFAPVLRLGADSGTQAQKLQSNANPFTAPELSDDGNILVYLSDEAGDDAVHTAYALREENGYADHGIICTQGGGDTGNTVAGTKDFAVAAWSSLGRSHAKDAGSVVTAGDEIIMMDSSEVYAGVYENGVWKTQALTDNKTADIAPAVAVQGERAIAVWRSVSTTNLNGNITDFNAKDTLLYRIYQNGRWGETKTLYNGTSGNIKALRVAMLPDGTAAAVYALDTDMNDTTTTDREICWSVVDAGGEMSRTVRATNDTMADENPQLTATSIDGKPCFAAAWYSSDPSGSSEKYDIHMADFSADGVIRERLPQSLEKLIHAQNLLITPDFRFTKGSETIDDLALAWVERTQSSTQEKTTDVEYDTLKALKFYSYGEEESRVGMTAARQLAKAPSSTLIDTFDVVSKGDTATCVFLGTQYDPERTLTKLGQTDEDTVVTYEVPFSTAAIYTAQSVYTDGISVTQVCTDTDSLRCAAQTSIAFTVLNEGINPLEKLTVELGGGTREISGLNVLPGDSVTVFADYKVPADSVRDEDYTLTAQTSGGSVSVRGTAALAKPAPVVTDAAVVEESMGERVIMLKLCNASDAKLFGSGRKAVIRFYSDPTCENPMDGLSDVTIQDDASLKLIDDGGYSRQVRFDVRAYLADRQAETEEIPQQGIPVYIRLEVVNDAGETLNSSPACIVCENLLQRTGNPVSVRNAVSTDESGSHVSADIRNNRLREAMTGNVIATLFDAEGQILEQKQSYDAKQGDSSLLQLSGEETKQVSFDFTQQGSYAQVIYTDLIMQDDTDASLSVLESTEITGVTLESFIKREKENIYEACVNVSDTQSITMLVSPASPSASVTLNGKAVEGFITAALHPEENTLDFTVTAGDGVTVSHYILTVNVLSAQEVIDEAKKDAEKALDEENAKDPLGDASAVADGKAAIRNAATLSQIEAAKNAAVRAIQAAQSEELAREKKNAKAALDAEDQKAPLYDNKILQQAKSLIDSAKTKAEVKKALEQGLARIREVRNTDTFCHRCGRMHGNTLAGKIVCLLVRIINFYKKLFKAIF